MNKFSKIVLVALASVVFTAQASNLDPVRDNLRNMYNNILNNSWATPGFDDAANQIADMSQYATTRYSINVRWDAATNRLVAETVEAGFNQRTHDRMADNLVKAVFTDLFGQTDLRRIVTSSTDMFGVSQLSSGLSTQDALIEQNGVRGGNFTKQLNRLNAATQNGTQPVVTAAVDRFNNWRVINTMQNGLNQMVSDVAHWKTVTNNAGVAEYGMKIDSKYNKCLKSNGKYYTSYQEYAKGNNVKRVDLDVTCKS